MHRLRFSLSTLILAITACGVLFGVLRVAGLQPQTLVLAPFSIAPTLVLLVGLGLRPARPPVRVMAMSCVLLVVLVSYPIVHRLVIGRISLPVLTLGTFVWLPQLALTITLGDFLFRKPDSEAQRPVGRRLLNTTIALGVLNLAVWGGCLYRTHRTPPEVQHVIGKSRQSVRFILIGPPVGNESGGSVYRFQAGDGRVGYVTVRFDADGRAETASWRYAYDRWQ